MVSEGSETRLFFLKRRFSIHGHPEPSSDGSRGVSEWFQRGFRVVSEGLKRCGFRGVSEWSKTVWFQSGFRVV